MSLIDKFVPKTVNNVSREDYIKKLFEDREELFRLNECIKGRITSGYFALKGCADQRKLLATITELYKNKVLREYERTSFSYDSLEPESLLSKPSENLAEFWFGYKTALERSDYSPEENVLLSIDNVMPIRLYHEWKNWIRNDKSLEIIFEETIGTIYRELTGIRKSKNK